MASAPTVAGSADAAGESSIVSYLEAFWPPFPASPAWDELAYWPPDVFALTNLLLDHSEAYRFAVAPPPGRRWPPFEDWDAQLKFAADSWRRSPAEPPPLARACWETLCSRRDSTIDTLRDGSAWELVSALLTLHALADEASVGIVSAERQPSPFEAAARPMLETHGSLSHFSSTRVRILPKTNFSPRGITIRSLSRHLALCYEAAAVRWCSVDREATLCDGLRLLLLPWPLSVDSEAFRPAQASLIDNMDRRQFGFFEFSPVETLDCRLVDALLDQAGKVDALILPESAVEAGSLPALEDALARHDVDFLIAGVRVPAGAELGRNYLHFGVRSGGNWQRYEQDKHHRWCLDEGQIRQYHLTRALRPGKLWWEAINLRQRWLHIIDVGGGITMAPMVCEDLASLDEVADHVRRIGPSLVVAVLLDGPQLAARWPCRYSSVLADDPGSSVLTLTSFGMAARCRPPGMPASRVVAHWNSRADGMHEIELARGAAGVLLRTSIEDSTVWTADGRRHDDVPRLRLDGVRQLRP